MKLELRLAAGAIVVPVPAWQLRLLLRLATMPKAHDRAQLKSTVTGPMPKAHIRAQLKSTSKLIASCTKRLAAGAIVAEAASCNLNDAEGS